MVTSSPLPEWLDPVIPKQLAEQTDRGAAIIGGSVVEQYLEQLLLARMRELSNKRQEYLFEGFGPLAGFAAKIEIAFALNLIGEMARNDLLQINAIRNKFAHEIKGPEWTFDHPEIKAKIDALQFVARMTPPPSGMPPVANRGKFVGCVYWFASILSGEVMLNLPTPYEPKFLGD